MLLRESSRAGQAASRADGRHSETIRIGPIDVCRLQSLKDKQDESKKNLSNGPDLSTSELGLCVHECCHFSWFPSFLEEYSTPG